MIKPLPPCGLILLVAACLLPVRGEEPPKAGKLQFNRDVRPILSENCFACHGPDKNKRKAKLRLDDRANALEKGAIVPGKPDESGLVVRILSDDETEAMPPPETHKKLSAAQK